MNQPARRATIRWALRLFRRDWRQQLLVVALLSLAVAGAVFGSGAAYNVASSRAAEFGHADHLITVQVERPDELAGFVADAQQWFGEAELVTHHTVAIPGSQDALDIRAQQPGGPYGAPMLALRDGRFPTRAGEIALTDGRASEFGVQIGDPVELGRDQYTVVGVVENPADLGDEFALAPPASGSPLAQLGDRATLLVRASDDKIRSFRPGSEPGPIMIEVRSATEKTTAAILVLVVSTVAMLLVSLIAAASFVSVAQRRMRQLGMFAAVGGTRRQLRVVLIANGATVGFVAAVLGTAAALVAWVVLAPAFEGSAGHRVDRFGVPWWVLVVGFALAIITASVAAWWPARSIARVPIVQAISGRPPRPRRARRSALAGVAFLVAGVACIGTAIDPTRDDAKPLLLIGGLIAVVIAILLLAVPALRLLALLAPRLPIGARLAVRDLARYQARAGAALAAISLGLAISIAIVAAAAAAEYRTNEGNLSNRQLIVWMRDPGVNGSLFAPAHTPAEVAHMRTTADNVARALGTSSDVLALEAVTDPNAVETRGGQPFHASVLLGRPISEHTVRDSGPVYVATPALLAHLGIDPATIKPGKWLLSPIPGDVFLTGAIAKSEYQRNPVPKAVVQHIPSGTYSSVPRTVMTEEGVRATGWEKTTTGWLIDAKAPISDAQLIEARNLAVDAGLWIETRDAQSGLGTLRTGATVAGILLALGIVAMTVSLLRGESARELLTLTACGATRRTRRAITATTAAALAALAVVLGGVSAYAALIAGYWGDTGGLHNVPVRHLLAIAIVLPLLAAGASWLLAGREPGRLGRAAIE